MKNFDVSVIIPVYNREKEIKKCIDSILAQTKKALEIIVVDDGSTDKTAEVVKAYNEPRIVYKYQDNRGQGIARNTGISIATGKYIGFVDSDDTIEAEMFEKLFNAAEKYSVQMVQCCVNYITDEKTKVGPAIDEGLITIKNKARYAHKYFLSQKHSNEVCNKLFLKEFITGNGIMFDDTKRVYSEDLSFNIRVIEYIERVYFLKDALYNYYISPQGHYNSGLIKRIDKAFFLYENALRRCENRRLRREIKCSGAKMLLSYCAAALETDEEKVREVLTSPILRRYIFASATSCISIKNSLKMLMFLCMPYKTKRYLIKNYCY